MMMAAVSSVTNSTLPRGWEWVLIRMDGQQELDCFFWPVRLFGLDGTGVLVTSLRVGQKVESLFFPDDDFGRLDAFRIGSPAEDFAGADPGQLDDLALSRVSGRILIDRTAHRIALKHGKLQ